MLGILGFIPMSRPLLLDKVPLHSFPLKCRFSAAVSLVASCGFGLFQWIRSLLSIFELADVAARGCMLVDGTPHRLNHSLIRGLSTDMVEEEKPLLDKGPAILGERGISARGARRSNL